MHSNCIYCNRPKEQHTNDGQIEILDVSGRCCPGFTSQQELMEASPMSAIMGTECLKDAEYALTRTKEILRDLCMSNEAAEVDGMVHRLNELHTVLESKARAGLERMNNG